MFFHLLLLLLTVVVVISFSLLWFVSPGKIIGEITENERARESVGVRRGSRERQVVGTNTQLSSFSKQTILTVNTIKYY